MTIRRLTYAAAIMLFLLGCNALALKEERNLGERIETLEAKEAALAGAIANAEALGRDEDAIGLRAQLASVRELLAERQRQLGEVRQRRRETLGGWADKASKLIQLALAGVSLVGMGKRS
ncbi:MAG: hypothetical protein ACE5HA_03320 [Anaerolineae bacterium]